MKVWKMTCGIFFIGTLLFPVFFAYADVIEPLKDPRAIQQAINTIHSINGENSPFNPEEKDVLRVTQQGEFVFSPSGFTLYKIYQTDANNDGKEESVIVQTDGAMRMFGLVGVFGMDGQPIDMEWLDKLLSEGIKEADADLAGLVNSDKLNTQETHKILAPLGEIQSDADVGFKKEKGMTYIVVKRVYGALLEAQDQIPYWHRSEGATAEVKEYLFGQNTNSMVKLIKTTPAIYSETEPLVYYQKSFGLDSLDAVPGFMKSMNEAYQRKIKS